MRSVHNLVFYDRGKKDEPSKKRSIYTMLGGSVYIL